MTHPMQQLFDQLDPSTIGQLAAQLGIDPDTAGQIVDQALPAIVAGMAGNARSDDGASALNAALDADHDGSLLDDLAGYLGGADTSMGGAILGHVFGRKKAGIADEIAQRLGLDPSIVSAALALLAPIVMGRLGKQRKEGGFDAGQLSELLPTLRDLMGGGGLADLLGGATRG